MKRKGKKLEQLTKRYNACDEATQLLKIMRGTSALLITKVRRVYPEEFQDEELIKAVKIIQYDLLSIEDEIADLAIELAEDMKNIREEKGGVDNEQNRN